MAKVGIIGLGMMGRTHYEAYQKLSGVQVVAVADENPKRAAGDLTGTGGNVLEGGLTQLPMESIKGHTDYHKLLGMSDVDIVDVCVPTPGHADVAVAALQSGKHVLCEKPLGRNVAEARRIADAAAKAKGFFMPAMCIRFWPAYAWLKKAVDEKRYGKVLGATFRRCATMPGGWFGNGKMSGGAVLDLHIHDTDFVYYLFGMPQAVHSRGYRKGSGEIDHIMTDYIYKDIPLVSAEGGWAMSVGFPFLMRYTANFEKATADFDLFAKDPLVVYQNGKREAIDCGPEAGYDMELRYFVDCVKRGERPKVVTADDAVNSIVIVEAERKSVETGQVVQL